MNSVEDQDSQSLNRQTRLPTKSEDMSIINCREVEDWAEECRAHRSPVLTSVNAFGTSLGLLLGFLPAFAATDVDNNGGWWGIFLMGTLVAFLGIIASAAWIAVERSQRVRTKLGASKTATPLERLAKRMEGAKDAGRAKAAQAAAEQGPRTEATQIQ